MTTDPDEIIHSSVNDVRVAKKFEDEEFGNVPTVAFQINSDRDENVPLELVEELPDGITFGDIGLHPEYGKEDWTQEDESTIRFERTLKPNETVMVVYGIRQIGDKEPEDFLTEPELIIESDSNNPESDDDGLGAGEPSSDSGEDEGNDDSGLGLDIEDDDDDDESGGLLGDDGDDDGGSGLLDDLDDDDDDDDDLDETGGIDLLGDDDDDELDGLVGPDEDEDDDSSNSGDAATIEGLVADQLADELTGDDVDEETREALREELGPGTPSTATSPEVAVDIESRLNAIRARLDDLRDEIDVDAATDIVDDIENDIQDVLDEYDDE